MKDAVTAFLILIAPLLVFLHELGYGILSGETAFFLVVALLFATALFYVIPKNSELMRAAAYVGVLLLFIDFQFELLEKWGLALFIVVVLTVSFTWLTRKHLRILLLIFFGAFNLATLILFFGASARSFVAAHKEHSSPEDLPVFVHLILDEHIGVAGIPRDIEGGAELAEELRDFYESYGFRVYGGAYSSYFLSLDSLATLLNLDASPPPERLYTVEDPEKGRRHVVRSNLYFQNMKARGYRIRVYQTAYMDFCRELDSIDSCFTYRHDRADREELRTLSVPARLRMIARMYGNFSFFVRELSQFYRFLRGKLGESGERLPAWSAWDGRVSPIATMPVIDKLATDIEVDSGGTLYFAHLLVPHYPYIYDRDCRIRPLSEWENRDGPERRESRARRNALYFEQVHCTMEKTRALFDRIKADGKFDDATILVHGDHGSRITSTDELYANRETLTDEEWRAGFSTLFAAKIPGQAAGFEPELRSITSLFREIVTGEEVPAEHRQEHHFYLKNDEGGWSPRSFPGRISP